MTIRMMQSEIVSPLRCNFSSQCSVFASTGTRQLPLGSSCLASSGIGSTELSIRARHSSVISMFGISLTGPSLEG